jgi:hypothetical protein
LTIMATAIKLSPTEIARRKQADALAELQKNGVDVPVAPPLKHPGDKRARLRRHGVLKPVYELDALGTVATMRTHEPGVAPIPPEREFTSRPDAVEIPPDGVCNIQPLRPSDAWELYEAAGDLWGWPDDDVRWGLTPAEVAKLPKARKRRQRKEVRDEAK